MLNFCSKTIKMETNVQTASYVNRIDSHCKLMFLKWGHAGNESVSFLSFKSNLYCYLHKMFVNTSDSATISVRIFIYLFILPYEPHCILKYVIAIHVSQSQQNHYVFSIYVITMYDISPLIDTMFSLSRLS